MAGFLITFEQNPDLQTHPMSQPHGVFEKEQPFRFYLPILVKHRSVRWFEKGEEWKTKGVYIPHHLPIATL
jgi:hypothetical protein